MSVVVDPDHPFVVCEVRCTVCDVVIASLVPLEYVVDKRVENTPTGQVTTIWKLGALSYNSQAGGDRVFTLGNGATVSIPVCRTCKDKVLSVEEVANALSRAADTTDKIGGSDGRAVSAELRRTAETARLGGRRL